MSFVRRPGPTRVLDTSIQAVEYFGLFYSSEVFENITQYTNDNAQKKRREDPVNNKGEWQEVTIPEIAFYGILIIMDIIRLDWDHMYWDKGSKYHMLGTNISHVMSRDRFFQIRRYLYFCDLHAPVNQHNKMHKIR